MLPIARIYASERDARGVLAQIVDAGIPTQGKYVVAAPAGDSPAGAEEIANAIRVGYALNHPRRGLAKIVAEAILRGRAVVVVLPNYGRGAEITRIMDEAQPIDTHLIAPLDHAPKWDEAAPVSSAFRIRPLLRKQPTPFSDSIGLFALSSGRSFMSYAFPELAGSASPLSSRFGLPVLKKASSFFGMKALSAKQSPGKSSFGLPLLTAKGKPMFGGLAGGPSPLSSIVGLPVLTKSQ